MTNTTHVLCILSEDVLCAKGWHKDENSKSQRREVATRRHREQTTTPTTKLLAYMCMIEEGGLFGLIIGGTH